MSKILRVYRICFDYIDENGVLYPHDPHNREVYEKRMVVNEGVDQIILNLKEMKIEL